MSDLYTTDDISKMDFKALKRKVQELEDTIAKMKRMYEDAIHNLDSSNFSASWVREQDNMKAWIRLSAEELSSVYTRIDENEAELKSEIKQTASEISSKVSQEDLTNQLENYSTLTQTAQQISSMVSKNIAAYFVRDTVPDTKNTSLKEKSMLCKVDNVYYYYNEIEKNWIKYSQEDGVSTQFIQTADGFEFDGNVHLKNNSKINIGSSATIGANLYLNITKDARNCDKASNGMVWFSSDDSNDGAESDVNAALILYKGATIAGDGIDTLEDNCVVLSGAKGLYLNDTTGSFGSGTNLRRVLTTQDLDLTIARFG